MTSTKQRVVMGVTTSRDVGRGAREALDGGAVPTAVLENERTVVGDGLGRLEHGVHREAALGVVTELQLLSPQPVAILSVLTLVRCEALLFQHLRTRVAVQASVMQRPNNASFIMFNIKWTLT